MKELDKIFKALADKNRLRILKLLENKKMCVCELAFVLGITQPSVSRHLRKLESVNLAGREQEGFWTNYYIKKENKYAKSLLPHLKKWLDGEETIKKDFEKSAKADSRKLRPR
jgi:ArsR family transcriptional regulator